MNKCILCTFFKMVWNGLWDNVCPSIDKKKEEKKAPKVKIFSEFVLFFLIIMIFAVSLALGLTLLIMIFIWWLSTTNVGLVLLSIIGLVMLTCAIFVIIKGIFVFMKIRIECIKAYWCKAKEVCE